MLLHMARRLAWLERARDPGAHDGAPQNEGGHCWTPRGARPEREFEYPHDLVAQYAFRLHHCLKRRTLIMKKVWRFHINSRSHNSGSVRPNKGDHVLTAHSPPRQPEVLTVEIGTALKGDLDTVTPHFPREKRDRSSWITGISFEWAPGDNLLIERPFRGGLDNMRLPVAAKLEEWNAHPLVHVAEPVLCDHRCVGEKSTTCGCFPCIFSDIPCAFVLLAGVGLFGTLGGAQRWRPWPDTIAVAP